MERCSCGSAGQQVRARARFCRPRRGLPAPDRGRAYSMFCTCSRNCSIVAFNDRPIEGQRQRDRFAAQRVRLAVEFLHQKIQLAADRRTFRQQSARCGDMRVKPVQLFSHVRLVASSAISWAILSSGKRGCCRGVSQLRHQAGFMQSRLGGGCRRGSFVQRLDLGEHAQQRCRPGAPPPPRPVPRPGLQGPRRNRRGHPPARRPASPPYRPGRRRCASRRGVPAATRPAAAARRECCPQGRWPDP